MQFTMYSRFNPTLAKLGADATADYAANLGFSSVEVLETTSPGHPSVIPDRETAKNIRRILFPSFPIGKIKHRNRRST